MIIGARIGQILRKERRALPGDLFPVGRAGRVAMVVCVQVSSVLFAGLAGRVVLPQRVVVLQQLVVAGQAGKKLQKGGGMFGPRRLTRQSQGIARPSVITHVQQW